MTYEEAVKLINEIEPRLLADIGLLNLRVGDTRYYGNRDNKIKDFPEYVNEYTSVEDFLLNIRKTTGACVTADKNGEHQCDNSRFRSFGDIFLITKTYFPDVTLLRIYEILAGLKEKGVHQYFRCPDVGKRVLCPTIGVGQYVTAYGNLDEYGIDSEMLKIIYEKSTEKSSNKTDGGKTIDRGTGIKPEQTVVKGIFKTSFPQSSSQQQGYAPKINGYASWVNNRRRFTVRRRN